MHIIRVSTLSRHSVDIAVGLIVGRLKGERQLNDDRSCIDIRSILDRRR